MRVRRPVAALAAPLALGVALLVTARAGHVAPSGARLEDRAAPALVLPDDRGGVFDLAHERGDVVMVTFGYVNCPDVCPMVLGSLADIDARLGADRARVRQVFVTLDPARDTPAALHAFLAQFSPAPLGLAGSPAATGAAAAAWGVTSRPAAGGAFLDHTALVAVVGPDGRERLRYGVGQLGDPGGVARDIARLLHEG